MTVESSAGILSVNILLRHNSKAETDEGKLTKTIASVWRIVRHRPGRDHHISGPESQVPSGQP